MAVAGNVCVLTRHGHMPIAALDGTAIEAWNGCEWALASVSSSTETVPLVRVWFEDGGYVDVSECQAFPIGKALVPALQLQPGMSLTHSVASLPKIEQGVPTQPGAAYIAGWATLTGFEDKNRLAVFGSNIATDPVLRRLCALSKDIEATADGNMTIRYEPGSIPAGYCPFVWSIACRRQWLAGALDSAAEWIEQPNGDKHLTFGTTDRDLVSEVRLMTIEAGITPRVRLTTAMNTFGIDMIQCAMLANEGVLLKNLDGLARNAAGQFTGTPCRATSITAVADIHPLPVPGIAYSVTAPKLKRVVMNGYETVCV
jgi:ribonucleoside-diphosphate reductase alpha chain